MCGWNTHCSGIEIKTNQIPFLFLALDLPPAPLYQDEAEKNIIPQVPLTTILQKYDGKQVQVGLDGYEMGCMHEADRLLLQ